MRILIVSHVIYPANCPRAHRTNELAKELARQGNEVTIYAALGNFDYSAIESKYGLKIKDFGKLYFEKLNSTGYNKLTLLDKLLSRLLGRFALYPSIELMWRIPRALKYEQNFDLMISISMPYPIHFGCAKAISKNRNLTKLWIADCGDPFMGNKFENIPFYFKYLEKWFCNKADFIAVPIDSAVNAYYHEFKNKIKIIPQGFNFDDIQIYKGIIKNQVPTFAYAGSFYKNKRDPSLFLDYLCSLKMNFKFVIYTETDELIRPYYKILKNKIEVRSYIERNILLYELSKLDFLVNIENIYKEQSPSKLIDYALTKRPILSTGCDHIDENKIFEFLHGEYKGRLNIEIEKYDIKNVAKQFINLLA